MDKKKLLVLAASRYQIPTITRAKQLGYYVITTDNVPENPGHRLADLSFSIDTTNMQEILDVAAREKIHGIIAAGTDVAVPTAAYVSEKLGLRGISFESARIACDKVAFRQFLSEHGFPSPNALPVTAKVKLSNDFFKVPRILKPDRSSGSKGVFVLNSRAEFQQRLSETLSFSPQKRGIIEEFINGFQGTYEGIVRNGELALSIVLDRQTVDQPYVATSGHHVPTRLPSHLQERLSSLLENILETMSITDATIDCDFVATKNEIYIIEFTPRMGGNSISILLKKATGFDLIEYSVRQACGDSTDLPEKIDIKPMAIVLLGVTERGHLYYDLKQVEALKQEKWVDSISFDVGLGEPVLPFINGRHRIGEAFVSGRDRADLDAKVMELKQRLGLKAI